MANSIALGQQQNGRDDSVPFPVNLTDTGISTDSSTLVDPRTNLHDPEDPYQYNTLAIKNTLDFFHGIGFDIEDNENPINRTVALEMIKFLSDRLLEKSFYKSLPAARFTDKEQEIEIEKLIQEKEPNYNLQDGKLHIPKYQRSRDIVPVYSSSVLPLLKYSGYKVHRSIDIGNLFGANSVPTNPDSVVGDYLLRDVIKAIHDKVGDRCFIVRLGGDEFGLVWKASDPENLISNEELFSAISGVHCLFNDKEGIHYEQAHIKITNEDPSSKAEFILDKEINDAERLQRLERFHPDFKAIFSQEIMANLDDESRKKLITLFETILFDPLLQEKAEEFGDQVHVYKDRGEFIEVISRMHREDPLERGGSVLRLDVSGIIKKINDDKRLDYKVGNQYIEDFLFENLVSGALGEVNPDEDLRIYRRGADLYMYLHGKSQEEIDSIEKTIYKKFGISEHYDEENAHIPRYTAERDGVQVTYPLMLSCQTESVKYGKATLDKDEQEFRDGVDFGQVQRRLDQGLREKYKKRVGQMKEILVRNNKPEELLYLAQDWVFIADNLNPMEKKKGRGVLRLKQYGLKDDSIEKLERFYRPLDNGQSCVLDVSLLTEYAETLCELFENNPIAAGMRR